MGEFGKGFGFAALRARLKLFFVLTFVFAFGRTIELIIDWYEVQTMCSHTKLAFLGAIRLGAFFTLGTWSPIFSFVERFSRQALVTIAAFVFNFYLLHSAEFLVTPTGAKPPIVINWLVTEITLSHFSP